MDKETNNIEYDLADVVIGRPNDFYIGDRRFSLFPVTLAKKLLLQRQIDSLAIDNDILKANACLEVIRLARKKRDVCCSILAIHTAPNTKRDLFDTEAINERREFLTKETSDDDLATMMYSVLTSDRYDLFMTHLGLDKERADLSRVMDVKRKFSKNNLSFGGKGIFGTFIGQLKEMGYSDDEILFERGYEYLRLMLADKVTSVMLTEEERGELPTSLGGTMLDGNDPNSVATLKERLKKSGVNVS